MNVFGWQLGGVHLVLGIVLLVVVAYVVYRLFFREKHSDPSEEGFDGKGTRALLFYSPSCGHCKEFMPTWDKLSKDYAGRLPFDKIDGEADVESANRYQIKGFPTVFLVVDGKPKEYQGNRDHNSLREFFDQAFKH
ncbi:MAG: protein disulfide isomerase family protein [Sulfobacillus sp.]